MANSTAGNIVRMVPPLNITQDELNQAIKILKQTLKEHRKMKNIGIIGASGYTGSELVRILVNHPEVSIKAITSETHRGKAFSDLHPFFRGIMDQTLISADDIIDMDLDLVFLALPHGISMDYVQKFKLQKFRIIDLSGDFRLDDPETYANGTTKNTVLKKRLRKPCMAYRNCMPTK